MGGIVYLGGQGSGGGGGGGGGLPLSLVPIPGTPTLTDTNGIVSASSYDPDTGAFSATLAGTHGSKTTGIRSRAVYTWSMTAVATALGLGSWDDLKHHAMIVLAADISSWPRTGGGTGAQIAVAAGSNSNVSLATIVGADHYDSGLNDGRFRAVTETTDGGSGSVVAGATHLYALFDCFGLNSVSKTGCGVAARTPSDDRLYLSHSMLPTVEAVHLAFGQEVASVAGGPWTGTVQIGVLPWTPPWA